MGNIVRHKRVRRQNLAYLGSVIITIFLLSTVFISVVQAGPLLQDERPPVGGNGGGGGGGDDGNGNGGEGDSGDRCATLSGEVINWGVGGMSGIGVELRSGSWQQFTSSASEGAYSFGGLGVGIARLRVALAPEQPLQPLIQDAGVYLNCNYPVVANIALFSGSRIDPPASITMSGPAELIPGNKVPLRLTVKNGLPTGISNVIVTDLMPQGLTALEVTAASIDSENLQIIDAGADGQLVAVFLDEMKAGDEINIFVTVTVAEGTPPGTQIRNAATLFYRESAADQDWVEVVIGAEGVSLPAPATDQVTPAPEAPESGPVLPAALSEQPTPEAATEDGAGFVPPGKIPGTGADLLPTTVETQKEDEAGFVPPGKLPSSGADLLPKRIAQEVENGADLAPLAELSGSGVDFIPPPDQLPVTGAYTWLIFDELPPLGLAPIALLIGLGLGGLLSVFRYLRSSRQDQE